MASKRAFRRRSCEGKRAWADPESAHVACRFACRRLGERMHVYHCKFCGKYHMGHRRK